MPGATQGKGEKRLASCVCGVFVYVACACVCMNMQSMVHYNNKQ